MATRGERVENAASGEVAVFLETAADSGGALVRMDYNQRPGGFVAFAHVHPDLEERFIVHEGEAKVRLGLRARTVRSGDELIVPPGVTHRVWNAGTADLHMTVEVRPALAFEDAFAEALRLGGARRSGRPSIRELAGISFRYPGVAYLPIIPRHWQRIGARLLAGKDARAARRRG